MLKTILVPLDGSQLAERVLPYAAHLARGAGARVVLLRVTGGVSVESVTAVGSPAATLANLAGDRGADLVVMATHGRGGLMRVVMGSVATGTLHRSTVPLLLLRPAAGHEPLPELARAAAGACSRRPPDQPRTRHR